MKICIYCKTQKELSLFSKNKRSKDGLQPGCKGCVRNYREENKVKNSDRQLNGIFTCTKCHMEKDARYFSPKMNSPTGIDYWCKSCRRTYAAKYRSENVVGDRLYQRNYLRQKINWLHSLKQDRPCKDCGKLFEPSCMDFDHLKDKIKAVSRMTLDKAPKDTILEEIKKCELVCVLCHNIRTQKRLDQKHTIKKYHKYALRNIEIINRAKALPCVECGQQYESYNMQLDHINPTEKFKNISQLKSFKVETLEKELNKCQVLCALCHRKKSISEQRAKQ